ncbi:uncharacterized protein LOC129944924 [Eupeodes corollae]|uniref:uncharacterized protein LOC129944924 n=1 Tax=Eupeodes corollae TaxID=290404 RepID=UPI00249243DF|nr:uncharacterized protein LOC129944924 [Eupeodes corollae]
MQENSEIAKGSTKSNREKVTEFWNRLTLELNSAGPPVKSEFEWNKASANKMHQKGTGGGPNKTQKFSPSEEDIFQLVGMKEAVEGVGSSLSFGLARPQNDIQSAKQCEYDATLHPNEVECVEAVDDFLFETELMQEDNSVQPTPTTSQAAKKRKMSTNDIIVEELQTQKILCNKVTEGVSVMRDHNTEVQCGIKKMYRSLDRLGDINKELLKEQQRHNKEMENLRKS